MLHAISPIDGRYESKTKELSQYFSEYALIKYRILVECEYYIFMSELNLKNLHSLDEEDKEKIRSIYEDFTSEEAESVKGIERTTNHDVKAVEYFIKDRFDQLGIDNNKEYIHFALTSQDINNTAFPLMTRDALNNSIYPSLNAVLDGLKSIREEWKDVPMLSRTHGQPASPSALGKEIEVFIERIEGQLTLLQALPIKAKFGGATGNFNAHVVTFPDIGWRAEGNEFIGSLGIERMQTTTQIAHYDHIAAIMDALSRISTIFIDFCRDIWAYVSMDYFKQKLKEGEVGSSAMPHKVNPIDFENAEGNLGIGIAIFDHLSKKLPISRLQRDLTDSTVLRNLGVPFGHFLIAMNSIQKGLGKLVLNEEKIKKDLLDNWVVVAEGIQNILRRENYPKPYEALKAFTRGKGKLDKAAMEEFVDTLSVSDEIKKELKAITPFNYIGYK